ncbi:MAG: hypothetical protein HOP28_01010, partial [Gemmatimonadales bacterium]|nr:hypothetical protein [Gemmatimonadales bacterium]
ITALGRTQGRVAAAGGARTADGDGLAVLAASLETTMAAEAEARREVEEALTAA